MRTPPSGRRARLSLMLARYCTAAAALIVLHSGVALAQHDVGTSAASSLSRQHELLFFVSAKDTVHSGLDTPVFDNHDFTPTADIFYSRSADRFRMLAEYLITDDEHDLERFQVGWQLSETTRIWFGRFHQPASYWITEHHHGQFLQTAINRPAIEEWEDLGGVLPAHTTGFLLEHQQEIGSKAGVQVSVGGGLTGTIVPQEIEPFDLLHPESGHSNSFSLRAAFLPDFLGENQIGVTYAHHRLKIEESVQLPISWASGVDKVDVTTAGLYAVWSWDKWHLSATGYDITATPRGGLGGPRTSFVASYAQAEYRFDHRLTAYARVEQTSGAGDYLDIFPRYIRKQALIGAKWFLTSKHALTLEVGNATLRNDDFHRFVLQWSAVVP